MNPRLNLRQATPSDIPALESLIPLSARSLQTGQYSAQQIDAALGPVFGVDAQLISDGTYFAVEHSGQIIASGGWSRRRAVFGGDRSRAGEHSLMDPSRDPARIRAFFVHPDYARQGIGRSLLLASEEAIRAAGFQAVVLVATLTGEPLYAAHGYSVRERYEIRLSDQLTLPVVRMFKCI